VVETLDFFLRDHLEPGVAKRRIGVQA